MDKFDILRDLFGYQEFREGQENIINSICEGRDVLAVMPTGSGKSICFQIPALLTDGITIVVSPLISLMREQVSTLVKKGVSAAFLNSSLTYPQYKKALSNAMNGMYKIIYIPPERLLSEDILQLGRTCNISIIAVDEAHCISTWGHDFRPHYKDISVFAESLPSRPVICAFTATATIETKVDIVKLLKLNNPFMLTTGFSRDNLFFEVRQPKSKFSELLRLLAKYSNKKGIIYCLTRKNVDELYEKLTLNNLDVTKYHAGLDDIVRHTNQELFLNDKINIMIATNAFGMGIDKKDIDYVIHYNMPTDIESYYQEAGRAGRDGRNADCIMLYSKKDFSLCIYITENGFSAYTDEETIHELNANTSRKLEKMQAYCLTSDCLMNNILSYFGELSPRGCGHCKNCKTVYSTEDCTQLAIKILRYILQTGECYGKTSIVKHFINKGITDSNHIDTIINELIVSDYLGVKPTVYSSLYLTERADEILNEKIRFNVKIPTEKENKTYIADKKLYELLRLERKRWADIAGMPPYAIFSNAILEELCEKKPTNSEEFLKIKGIGFFKYQAYGKGFLDIIVKYMKMKG